MVNPDELKIREVFDAIETGQNKMAVKICNALLTKNSRLSQLARVLKAISLDRMGKDQQALEECSILQRDVPTNEDILRKLSYVYRSLNRTDLATIAYENAYNKEPTEDLAQGVFLSYARELRFNDQRSFSFKLMKQFPKCKKYYYWAAVSYIQQVATNDMKPDNINLMMASRTLEKVEKQFSITTIEELRFMIYVYEVMENNTAVLKLIEKYSSLFTLPGESQDFTAKYQMKMKCFDQAQILYKELLVDFKKQNWFYLKQYIECQCNGEEITSEIVGNVRKLLEDMQVASNSSVPLRLIHLGRLYALCLLYKAKGKEDTLNELQNEIISYLDVFGSKPVCFRDVQMFLPNLPCATVRTICEAYEAKIQEESKETENFSIKVVYRRVLLEQLKNKYKFYENFDNEKTSAVVEEYLAFYSRALAIPSALSLTETERQYADDLILLSVHLYVDLYLRNGTSDDLIRALSIAILGIEKSKYNFHLKIAAMKAYCLLGALKPSFELYKTLETKHIQMDTFSHVVLSDAIGLRIADCTEPIVFAMERFYSDSLREMPELVTYPYTKESYSRAREFRDFNDKISNSIQRAVHNIEYNLSEFISKATPADSLEDLKFSADKVLYKDEDFAKLYETADNSFWDNWHSIYELSSPYVTSCATTIRTGDERIALVQARGILLHFSKAILENEPEMANDFMEKFQVAYNKVSFDEESKEMWNQIFLMFRFLTHALSIVGFLKGSMKLEDVSICKSAFDDLVTLRESLTATENLLIEKTKEKFLGKHLPLHNFYVSNLCWMRLLFSSVAPLVPKRLKKNASATVKESHKKIRAELRTFNNFVAERQEKVSAVYSECAELSFSVSDIVLPAGCSADLLNTVSESIATSYKESFADLVKRSKAQ